MATEKLITSLEDLQNAAKQAALDGICTIRLQDGEKLVLVQAQAAPQAQDFHEVTDPEEEKVVFSCLRPGGQYYAGEQAREELKRRLAARGIKV